MRLDRGVFLFALPVLLIACSETPRCVERGTPPRTSIVIECNSGKVPVCGNDPAVLYDERGALRPVPAESVADGLCPAGATNCRTRPVCQQDTLSPVCNDGLGVTCVLGAIEEIAPPRADSGPAPQDAGPPDDEDAGSDAGTEADAGTDAGD